MEESQAEEREVLTSIFEGDPYFKEISPTCFQYKVVGAGEQEGETENHNAFILEISWPSGYPEELPDVNLDTFFNKHIPSALKEEIKDKILEQAEDMRESAMTYSLFDWMRESAEEYISKIPECAQKENAENTISENSSLQLPSKSKEKKEILTKAQKRRITERTNFRGERARGWDWVDIVKHLCQTGSSENK